MDELIVDDGSLNKEDEIKEQLLAKIQAAPEQPAHFHDGYHTEAPTLVNRRLLHTIQSNEGYQTQ